MTDKDERLSEAIDAVARSLAYRELMHSLLSSRLNAADYPSIGSADFEAVRERVERVAESLLPTVEQLDAAYDFLEAK